MVKRDNRLVLTVFPPCTRFSIANQGPVSPVDLAGAKELMRFAVEMCELQLKGERSFVLEEPLTSRAWSLEPVMKLMITKGVIST